MPFNLGADLSRPRKCWGLPRASVSQIFLQGHGDKQYLYIQQASEEGFTIVDVTKPYRPNVVNRVKLPNKASGETL
jgi:hypothetical protein